MRSSSLRASASITVAAAIAEDRETPPPSPYRLTPTFSAFSRKYWSRETPTFGGTQWPAALRSSSVVPSMWYSLFLVSNVCLATSLSGDSNVCVCTFCSSLLDQGTGVPNSSSLKSLSGRSSLSISDFGASAGAATAASAGAALAAGAAAGASGGGGGGGASSAAGAEAGAEGAAAAGAASGGGLGEAALATALATDLARALAAESTFGRLARLRMASSGDS
mmetsp:Transcript_69336/g.137481  ORF Transcript_69336/g.137481 Transcript_69336/m.137481 type:complete len:222 (+) Transcript_69336:3879-4544(+)